MPDFIDKAAWDKDEKARDQLSARATRLETLSRQVVDTNRVIGFDIYNTCSTVYQNARFLSTKNVPGTKPITTNGAYSTRIMAAVKTAAASHLNYHDN